MTLGKLIEEALKLCNDIVEAEEALGNLGVRGSSCSESVDWLRWAMDQSEGDTGVKEMCDACDTEAAMLIRDQLFLPRVQKLRDLLGVEVGDTVKSKRRNKAAK